MIKFNSQMGSLNSIIIWEVNSRDLIQLLQEFTA